MDDAVGVQIGDAAEDLPSVADERRPLQRWVEYGRLLLLLLQLERREGLWTADCCFRC